MEKALTEKQQENVAILLEHQNEKQQAFQQRELEWLAGKIKVFTEEEQKAILASACAFAEHGLIITPSITIQLKDTCSQQDLMYFVCSAFFNIVRSVVILQVSYLRSFRFTFLQEKVYWLKRCRDWKRLGRKGRKKINPSRFFQHIALEYISI